MYKNNKKVTAQIRRLYLIYVKNTKRFPQVHDPYRKSKKVITYANFSEVYMTYIITIDNNKIKMLQASARQTNPASIKKKKASSY